MGAGKLRGSAAVVTAVVAVLAVVSLTACEPLPLPALGSVLVGCSQAGQRVQLTTTSHLDPTCTYTKGFDITASGVTLDCQGAKIATTDFNSLRGIQIAAPEGVALHDVTVRNCKVEGFLNSIRVLREGYRTYGPGLEYQTPTAGILIEKNTFTGSRGVGVYVDAYVEDVTIANNVIRQAGSTGIYLETGSRRNHVVGNSLLDNGYRENGPNGQVRTFQGTDFWFWGVGREGVAIDGSYENVITGNAFLGNSNGGIFLYKNCGEYPTSNRYFERRHHADDNLIESNTFIGGRNGVWVGSRMGENTIGMECTDPAYVQEGLTRITLDFAEGNTIRSNRFFDVTYAMRVEDDDTVVEGNSIEGTQAGLHGLIVGTPYRTDVLGHPVTGTVIRGNTSSLPGNAFPYRWVHGHAGTTFEANTALGAPATWCEGQPPPRQILLFVIAVALPGPGGTPPATTPDLTVPVLGELPPCSAG